MSSQTYIAVVDDDESLCRSLARLLRAAGMQPITYLSAEEFLADDKHPRFDCLVLDVQLGGMSGLDLQRTLRERPEAPPIIFITAHDDLAARLEAETEGCEAYFRKTDSGAQILEAIRQAIARTHLSNPISTQAQSHQ